VPASSDLASTQAHDGRGDEGTVDPDYVGDWGVAPGSKGDFVGLSLRADGAYVRTNAATAKTETGTWSVVYHEDWDWIWDHELFLRTDGGLAEVYGVDRSLDGGYTLKYPNGSHD